MLPGSPFGPVVPGGTIEPVYRTYVCASARQRLYCVAQRTVSPFENVALSFAQDPSSGTLSDLRMEAATQRQANPGFWLIQSVGDRFVYAAFGTLIQGFRIESSGALTAIPGLPIESGPLQTERLVQLVAHPSGRFLYAVAANFNITGPDVGHVDGFEIDQQTGALRVLTGSPFLGGNAVSTGQDDQNLLVIEPRGQFALQAVNGGILKVLISPNGSLSSGGVAVRQFMSTSDVALASW